MNKFMTFAKANKVPVITLGSALMVLILLLTWAFVIRPNVGAEEVKAIDSQSESDDEVPTSHQNKVSAPEKAKDMEKEAKSEKKKEQKVTNEDGSTSSKDANTTVSEGESVTNENESNEKPAPGVSEDNPRESGSSEDSKDEGKGSGSEDKGDGSKSKGDGSESKEKPKAPKNDADCNVSSGVSGSRVIVVRGTGGANATVAQCKKGSDGTYNKVSSSKGHVGYAGISASKREGDGKTPAGVFYLDEGFGVKGKPGSFSGSWTKVTKDHVWVDGKGGPKGYNTLKKKSDGYKGESMYQTPAYNYGQVIGYNKSNTADKGSAIFLHVNTGSGKTAGCVSVSQSYLLNTFAFGASQIDIK